MIETHVENNIRKLRASSPHQNIVNILYVIMFNRICSKHAHGQLNSDATLMNLGKISNAFLKFVHFTCIIKHFNMYNKINLIETINLTNYKDCLLYPFNFYQLFSGIFVKVNNI